MSKKLSKKEEEQVVKGILVIIFIPIILIYLLIKYTVWVIKYITGSDNNVLRYRLNLSTDEKEQLEKIDKMDGKEFERFMSAILVKNGFSNVSITKASGDHGADILGEQNGVKYAFQCKRFESKVSSKPIGEVLRGINYYKCDKGIVITNNYFTKQAINEAAVNNVELWDRDKIISLYQKVLKDKIDDPSVTPNKLSIGIDKKRLITFCIAAIISGIIIFLIINYIKDVKNDMQSDESRIAVQSLESDIYNIATEVVDNKEFELAKSNISDGVDYIIKYKGFSLEHYETAFKAEVTKVYNKIKDKELKYRTLLGYQDCSKQTISFILKYKSSPYDETLGRITLKYSNDDRWTSSYEEEINKQIINKDVYDKMYESVSEY